MSQDISFQLKFSISDAIYLRDPEGTDMGKNIVRNAIDLIYELGFEHFTFKKLAQHINTTEATIYRYFESKHRLLLYIMNWYWSYLDFLLMLRLQNVHNAREKLEIALTILTHDLTEHSGSADYNKLLLSKIVLSESSKSYLVKEVSEINKRHVFGPYKNLSNKIAALIHEYNPTYQYPSSLSTSIIETAHDQQYFVDFLPGLTDIKSSKKNDFVYNFIHDLTFKALQ